MSNVAPGSRLLYEFLEQNCLASIILDVVMCFLMSVRISKHLLDVLKLFYNICKFLFTFVCFPLSYRISLRILNVPRNCWPVRVSSTSCHDMTGWKGDIARPFCASSVTSFDIGTMAPIARPASFLAPTSWHQILGATSRSPVSTRVLTLFWGDVHIMNSGGWPLTPPTPSPTLEPIPRTGRPVFRNPVVFFFSAVRLQSPTRRRLVIYLSLQVLGCFRTKHVMFWPDEGFL